MAVRVTIPNVDGVETPVPDVVLTFVPYDRDSVLQLLEAKAGPRPHTQELDSVFRAFRAPFTAYLAVTLRKDRLKAARDSLQSLESPREGSQEPQLAAIRDSLKALEPERNRARIALEKARAALVPRMDSLRQDVNRWQSLAYLGYDSIVRRLRERAFVNAVADTTDFGGWGTIRIPAGRWWVTARTIDPKDPNAEWYWNVRIDRDTVRLDPRTGRNRPRY